MKFLRLQELARIDALYYLHRFMCADLRLDQMCDPEWYCYLDITAEDTQVLVRGSVFLQPELRRAFQHELAGMDRLRVYGSIQGFRMTQSAFVGESQWDVK